MLQELRTEGVLAFLGEGTYLLLTNPIDETTVDLPDETIDAAISKSLMLFKDVDVREVVAQTRQRRGVQRLREFVIRNYNNRCAVCDVSDPQLLRASHISRWSDDTEARGHLSNVICFCTFHDALFEFGYFSLSDSYAPMTKSPSSETVEALLAAIREFRVPRSNCPAGEYLRKHRRRVGFEN